MCRHLARDAPKHLNEDGYFQMLCEWAQVRGQSWQERISEWLANTGCDAWVMKGQSLDPSQYAQERIREITYLREHDDKLYSDYMSYYREKEVEAIHTGIIAVRRRSGRNWLLMEEISHSPKESFGETVLQMFASRDFLESHASDDQILGVKPKLSPDLRLEQVFQQNDHRWQQSSLTLKLVKGLPFSLGVQPLVAEFLSECNGTRSLAELIGNLAEKVNAPPARVQEECLGIIRTLVERGFVRW